MVGKFCRAPKSGGSARGNVRYILGYELGPDKKNTRESYADLMLEAMQRGDLGVGTVWEPAAGKSIRPAAVYASGVTSLATADVEMEAVAAANTRLQSSATMHLVHSFSTAESATMTNAQAVEATRLALEKLGLGHHQMVLTVHRDTLKYDAAGHLIDGNLHVHSAVARVDPLTLKAWDTTRHYYRMAWVDREVELDLGLQHDRGAAVADMKIDGTPFVRWATKEEKKAWKIESSEQRLENQARRYMADYATFENAETWARDVLGSDVAQYMSAARERNERFRSADVHAIFADKAARVEVIDADHIRVRVMQRLTDEEIATARADAIANNPELQKRDSFGERVDTYVPTQREVAQVEIAIGDFLGFTREEEARDPQLRERAAFLRTLCTVDESEARFIEQMQDDVSLVSREIIANGQGAFTRNDIAAFIARRVSDPAAVMALCDLVEKNDKTLRMLSTDTEHPLYSTEAQLELEQRVQSRAKQLAEMRDERFDDAAMQRAIDALEQRKGFPLTAEQSSLLRGAHRRLSWANGDAGTGKTTAMLGLQMYAQETGRRVVGLSLSEKASRELGRAANVKAMNVAKALFLENCGRPQFRRGDIIIIDETSMTAHRQLDRLLDIARERDCTVFGIGDKAQLQSLEAGSAHDVVMNVAREVGAFQELTIVRRQEGELAWMSYNAETKQKGIVHELGQAIRERDAERVSAAMREFGERGLMQSCADRATAMAAAAQYYLDATRNGETALLLAGDRLTCRHLNDSLRELIGTAGQGQRFRTASDGVRELSVGDRFVFLENARLDGERVANGDTGTVRAMSCNERTGRWSVTVELDKHRRVTFDPQQYRSWSHGFSLTVTKGQGSTVDRVAGVIDKSAYAELFHVMMTRAQHGARCFFSEANFSSVDDVALHVGERIRGKDDALLLKEIEARTGGPDTPWAIRVREAMKRAHDPLRIQHRQFLATQHERFERAVAPLHERYTAMAREHDAAPANKKADLRRAQAAEARALRQKYPLLSFVQWAARERTRIEHDAMREQQVRDYTYRQREKKIDAPTLQHEHKKRGPRLGL